ncbi:hypothetical protein P8452_61291 [Trifolium repens]|nr:hypothetical protein P8452_61291 [Trifolium repens]
MASMHQIHGGSSDPPASEDPHAEIKPYLITARSCYIEFDPMKSRAKLPVCFTRSVGSFIRGWVKVFYISPLLFYIRVRRITGLEVVYPERNPPYRLVLNHECCDSYIHGPMPFFLAPSTFYHKLQKSLTSSDIASGVLELSWDGFCERALPDEETHITLVDWFGFLWKCRLGFQQRPTKTCQISGDWPAICKVHNLTEGKVLTFGAPKASNNRVIHFKIRPFIGVRTTFIKPAIGGPHRAFYQADEYFIL